MIQKVEKLVVEPVDVDEYGRLLVQTQILPCQHLEHLFEGSETAGQDKEGVCELGHFGFAGVHGGGDVEFGQAAVSDLQIDERFGNNAYDTSSAGETGFGERFHKPDIGSAIDHTDVLFCKRAAETDGRFKI